MSFLSQADHNWTKHSRCGITSAEVKAHLPELEVLFLKQPRNLLATRVHCWLMFNFSKSIPVLCKDAFQSVSSPYVLLSTFIICRCRTLHYSLLNFVGFLFTPFFSLLRPL